MVLPSMLCMWRWRSLSSAVTPFVNRPSGNRGSQADVCLLEGCASWVTLTGCLKSNVDKIYETCYLACAGKQGAHANGSQRQQMDTSRKAACHLRARWVSVSLLWGKRWVDP